MDLEKELNGKLAISSLFKYEGSHPDFLVIKVHDNKVILELIEFKKNPSEEEIRYALLFQLIQFLNIIEGKIKDIITNFDEIKLIIVVKNDNDVNNNDVVDIANSNIKEFKSNPREYVKKYFTSVAKKATILRDITKNINKIRILLIVTTCNAINSC
ncbi:hypothetical protein [Sulfolobus sp. E11-6]|uniref:hypothetical protein n=1 Tax=Sulfolobus sp. E11-6 TaxID=2663020 RepID=UPI0012961455|nr:hypothetical protein [Sulfolobus sp. E11-6]QGA68561.1 hypothetical protein GFS33_07320 [Sulfolobus sp. E11-6]